MATNGARARADVRTTSTAKTLAKSNREIVTNCAYIGLRGSGNGKSQDPRTAQPQPDAKGQTGRLAGMGEWEAQNMELAAKNI